MYKDKITAGALLLSSVVSAGLPAELNGPETLKLIDDFRSESESVKVSTTVISYKDGEPINTRQYDIYSATNRRTLILFKSAAEQGQKVLIRDNDYWMFMPRSRRPIRITPMQKLLGDASLGDIATLSWSQDYEVSQVTRSDATWQFELHANSAKLSYQKILLEVDAADLFPLQAALYLRSGMHVKTAGFERGFRNGKARVVSMTLHDEMRQDQKTKITYDHIQPIEVSDRLFNPQVLIRTDLDQLLTE